MAGLQEETRWENEIYRIEENDPVHGGEDGITNKPLKQLANRTKYLKAEVEKRYIAQDASTEQKGLVQLDSSTDSDSEDKAATPKAVNAVKLLVNALRSALSNYIPNSKKSNDDNSTSSDTVATSYAVKKVRDIATKKATDTVAGQTVLSHKTDGTDKSKAASEFALGELNKELAGKGVPLGAVVSFPKGMNPNGYLRAIGGTFNKTTYPDLYIANGNSDILPNLHRSDVGMTAYFPFDDIPEGWIAFDSIRTTVTQQDYPDLYQYLVDKYGAISNVPLAEDRFIRNAGNGLNVGQTQGDAIRNITGRFGPLDNSISGGLRGMLDGPFYLINEERYFGLNADWNSNNPLVGFDISRVVPTANENRPKNIVMKLCIKAKNTFDNVNFWIKAFGTIENAGSLNAGALAQDIQQVSSKTQKLEESFNQNKEYTTLKIQEIKNKVLNDESVVVWTGSVTQHSTNIIQLSDSILNKKVTFYLKVSSGHTLSDSNDLHTFSMYVDKRILTSSSGKKYLHGAQYTRGGWVNLQIELVKENQIIIKDVSGMFLKQITAI